MDLYNKDRNKYYPNIPRPEIEVIFEDLKGKIIINVHKNESLNYYIFYRLIIKNKRIN